MKKKGLPCAFAYNPVLIPDAYTRCLYPMLIPDAYTRCLYPLLIPMFLLYPMLIPMLIPFSCNPFLATHILRPFLS